jgi:hypothetical protein
MGQVPAEKFVTRVDRQREAVIEQRAAVLREVEAFREAIKAKLQLAAALAKQAGMVTNDSQ